MIHVRSRRLLASLILITLGGIALGAIGIGSAGAREAHLTNHEFVVQIAREGKTYTMVVDFLLLDDGSGGIAQKESAAQADMLAKLNDTSGQTATASTSTSAYVLSGFSWPSHTVSYSYNPAGKPASLSGDQAAVQAAANTWSTAGANFSFTGGSTTSAATGACNGAADGQNTIGWAQQSGSVLALTCSTYAGANELEFDMQLSPSWTWTTGSPANVDLQSVVTHELGHAAGLGHSTNPSAVMYASYTIGTIKRTLTSDDIAGVVAIYGTASAATPPPPTPTTVAAVAATLTFPAPGSTLPGSTATFAWNAGTQALEYFFYLGTSAGANNLYGQSTGLNRSVTVGNIPTVGAPVYARLWTRFSNGWQYVDYNFTETSQAASARAQLLTPAPGSTVAGGSATFTWTAGPGAQQYFLYIGTTPGSNSLYGQSTGLNRSLTISGLPRGMTLYVRVWTLLPTGWQYADSSFVSS